MIVDTLINKPPQEAHQLYENNDVSIAVSSGLAVVTDSCILTFNRGVTETEVRALFSFNSSENTITVHSEQKVATITGRVANINAQGKIHLISLRGGLVRLNGPNSFKGCTNLEVVRPTTWDTQGVTSFEGTFLNCSSLIELDVSGWDVTSSTSFVNLFQGCSSLKYLDLSQWSTTLFDQSALVGCNSLQILDLGDNVSMPSGLTQTFQNLRLFYSTALTSGSLGSEVECYVFGTTGLTLTGSTQYPSATMPFTQLITTVLPGEGFFFLLKSDITLSKQDTNFPFIEDASGYFTYIDSINITYTPVTSVMGNSLPPNLIDSSISYTEDETLNYTESSIIDTFFTSDGQIKSGFGSQSVTWDVDVGGPDRLHFDENGLFQYQGSQVIPNQSLYLDQVGNQLVGTSTDQYVGSTSHLSRNGMRLSVGTLNPAPGEVRIYNYDGASWNQIGQTFPGRVGVFSEDGSILAVGSYRSGTNNTGTVNVYTYDAAANTWIPMGVELTGDITWANFGLSISLSVDGQRLLVGSRLRTGDLRRQGRAQIFQFDGSNWIQIWVMDGAYEEMEFGYYVSLSDDGMRAAVSSIKSDTGGFNRGDVMVFHYNGVDNWEQLGSTIHGENNNDQNGVSISLNQDGSRVAIGARLNDDAANNAGHVRVYEYDGSQWIQLGEDKDGITTHDNLGRSVSLSRDGSRLAVSASAIDGFGYFEIYEYDGTDWVSLVKRSSLVSDDQPWFTNISGDGSRVAMGSRKVGANAEGEVRVFDIIDPNPQFTVTPGTFQFNTGNILIDRIINPTYDTPISITRTFQHAETSTYYIDIPISRITVDLQQPIQVKKIILNKALLRVLESISNIRLICDEFMSPSRDRISSGMDSRGHFAVLYQSEENPLCLVSHIEDSIRNESKESQERVNKIHLTLDPPVTLSEDSFISLLIV